MVEWVREFCGFALTQSCVLVDPEVYVAWLFLSVLLWFAASLDGHTRSFVR